MKSLWQNWIIAALSGLFLSGCAGLFEPDRQLCPLPTCADWQRADLSANGFDLVAYEPPAQPSDVDRLVVYIEGDGRAYTRGIPRRDPTPRTPLALELALKDDWTKKVYLARPCQYLQSDALARCNQVYWTTGRYASEAVEAMDGALDQLKQRHGATRLSLVGYSGGGVMAVLLAARRSDVDSVLTAAAPLDLDHWADHHEVTRLFHSQKPLQEAIDTGLICQTHLIGQMDEVVPALSVQRFVWRIASPRVKAHIIEQVDHRHGWVDLWPRVLETYRQPGTATLCR